MKCDNAQCLILLADSCELPRRKADDLETHLASCPDCRKFRDSTRRIVADAKVALEADGPSNIVLARIRAEAQKQASSGVMIFWHPVVRILAYAAAIALIAGGWFIILPGTDNKQVATADRHLRVKTTQAEHLSHLNTIASALMVPGYLESDEQSNGNEQDPNLQDFAHQLLIMEGLAAECNDEAEFNDPDAEPLPTDLRSSNTCGLQARICV